MGDDQGRFRGARISTGQFAPYVRGEYMRFPSGGAIVYQYTQQSSQGVISRGGSLYAGTTDFTDLRLGLRWMPVPQVALKLEVERIGKDSNNQEPATLKMAFGF